MLQYLTEAGKIAAAVLPILVVLAMVSKALSKGLAAYKSRSLARWEIRQCDRWWTARDRNPIFSRRR